MIKEDIFLSNKSGSDKKKKFWSKENKLDIDSAIAFYFKNENLENIERYMQNSFEQETPLMT